MQWLRGFVKVYRFAISFGDIAPQNSFLLLFNSLFDSSPCLLFVMSENLLVRSVFLLPRANVV